MVFLSDFVIFFLESHNFFRFSLFLNLLLPYCRHMLLSLNSLPLSILFHNLKRIHFGKSYIGNFSFLIFDLFLNINKLVSFLSLFNNEISENVIWDVFVHLVIKLHLDLLICFFSLFLSSSLDPIFEIGNFGHVSVMEKGIFIVWYIFDSYQSFFIRFHKSFVLEFGDIEHIEKSFDKENKLKVILQK